MVRYPFDLLRAVSQVEPLTMNEMTVRPEVSKGERGFSLDHQEESGNSLVKFIFG